ncbi:MAG: hypothetical protein BWY81_00055 [Firmicutes bacterium ADurb.Bin467]|nr:MAG: hypothetical protein BWY81_00055 [Firmicutes bacterium ADurb.Bin467]
MATKPVLSQRAYVVISSAAPPVALTVSVPKSDSMSAPPSMSAVTVRAR